MKQGHTTEGYIGEGIGEDTGIRVGGDTIGGEEGTGVVVFSLQLFWKNMSLARRISLHAATWASDSGITFASSCRRMLCCVSMSEQLLITPVPNSTVDSHTPGAIRPGRVPARERTVVRVDSILVQTDNSKLSDSMSICSAVKQGHVTASGVGDGQMGEGPGEGDGGRDGEGERDGDGGEGKGGGGGGGGPLSSQLLKTSMSLESSKSLHATASASVSGSSPAPTYSSPYLESMKTHVLTMLVPYSIDASHTEGMIPERRPVRLRVVIRDDWIFVHTDNNNTST